MQVGSIHCYIARAFFCVVVVIVRSMRVVEGSMIMALVIVAFMIMRVVLFSDMIMIMVMGMAVIVMLTSKVVVSISLVQNLHLNEVEKKTEYCCN